MFNSIRIQCAEPQPCEYDKSKMTSNSSRNLKDYLRHELKGSIVRDEQTIEHLLSGHSVRVTVGMETENV